MNDCNRWLERLLQEGATAEVLRDFKRLYSELMFGISMNDEFSRDEIFDVIKTMGNDNNDAVDAKIYLAYVIGKFQASDAYAEAIGNNMIDDELYTVLIDKIMQEAIDNILNR